MQGFLWYRQGVEPGKLSMPGDAQVGMLAPKSTNIVPWYCFDYHGLWNRCIMDV